MSENNGHTAWVSTVLERHEADLLRYARRLTGDDGLARDVVQETFLRLCQQDRSRLDGHLVEWLYTVCRNRAFDVRRKEQRMNLVAADVLADIEAGHPSPAGAMERSDDALQLLDWLTKLPEKQQEVIRLKFQSGLRYRDIAAITGLTESYVGVLLHEALRFLRQNLKSS